MRDEMSATDDIERDEEDEEATRTTGPDDFVAESFGVTALTEPGGCPC